MQDPIGTPRTLHLINQNRVEQTVRLQGPMTKLQISKATGLSQVTVNRTADLLVKAGRIRPCGAAPSTGGRMAQTYEFCKNREALLCICYQNEQIESTLINLAGERLAHRIFGGCPQQIDACLSRCIDAMLAQAGDTPVSVLALGVPGVVREGVLTQIPQIPSWEGTGLARTLIARYHRPVLLENDVNLAALGLCRSLPAPQPESLALLHLDAGVGCGLVLNHALFQGGRGFAGEVGVLPVSGSTFEPAFLALARQLSLEKEDASRLALRRQLIALLAIPIRSLCCVLDPQVLALSCPLLTPDDLPLVARAAGLSAGAPHLRLISSLQDCAMDGLSALALSHATASLTFSIQEG